MITHSYAFGTYKLAMIQKLIKPKETCTEQVVTRIALTKLSHRGRRLYSKVIPIIKFVTWVSSCHTVILYLAPLLSEKSNAIPHPQKQNEKRKIKCMSYKLKLHEMSRWPYDLWGRANFIQCSLLICDQHHITNNIVVCLNSQFFRKHFNQRKKTNNFCLILRMIKANTPLKSFFVSHFVSQPLLLLIQIANIDDVSKGEVIVRTRDETQN